MTIGELTHTDDRTATHERVFELEAERLWRALLAFTGGRTAIAEEAVAEAFARALARSDEIREPARWIYRVAMNVAVDEIRRESRIGGAESCWEGTTMTERWQAKLAQRRSPALRAERIWREVHRRSLEPRSPSPISSRRRVLTAAVALAVFVPTVVFGWLAFRPSHDRSPASDDVFFPTWLGDARPAALLSGVLIERDGCLFLARLASPVGSEQLILWDARYSFADGAIVGDGGSVVARVGDTISGGGDSFGLRGAEQITGETIPGRCIPHGPEQFAMLYDIAVVSPAPVEVPDVTGLTWREARQQLEGLDLMVERHDRAIDAVPEAVAAAEDPHPGSSVQPGSTVTVVVSNGPTGAVQRIDVGELPEIGIVIADDTGVTLSDVDGNVLATLPGFEMADHGATVPGVWLRGGPTYYVLDPSAGALVAEPPAYARDQMARVIGPPPELPEPYPNAAGHCEYQLLSSGKGTASLAQWSGECEAPTAFWIDQDGTQHIVTGEDGIGDAPESFALGWSIEREAIVLLPEGACGGTYDGGPGVYAFSAPGDGRLIVPTTGFARAQMWEPP